MNKLISGGHKASSPALFSNQKTTLTLAPTATTTHSATTEFVGRKKPMLQKYSEIESLACGIIMPSGDFRSQQAALHYTRHFTRLLDRIIKTPPELQLEFDEQKEDARDLEIELKKMGAEHATIYMGLGKNTVSDVEFLVLNKGSTWETVGANAIEALGEALTEAFVQLDTIRHNKETMKAWRLLISNIIDIIREGYDTELRLQRRFLPGFMNSDQMSSTPKERENINVGDSAHSSNKRRFSLAPLPQIPYIDS